MSETLLCVTLCLYNPVSPVVNESLRSAKSFFCRIHNPLLSLASRGFSNRLAADCSSLTTALSPP